MDVEYVSETFHDESNTNTHLDYDYSESESLQISKKLFIP